MAVTSAGPYANNMHLAPDRQQHQHLINQFFTGRMLSLTPNQQCQGTEGICKTFEFQLNRLYKCTCWTSDRNTPFPLGYRNMDDRI